MLVDPRVSEALTLQTQSSNLPASPQRLSSFLGSPEANASQSESPMPQSSEVHLHQHRTLQSRDQGLHLHETNTLNQDVRIQQNVAQMTNDPEVQAQAFAVVQQAAYEVDVARRQAVAVATPANQELEARNAQAREALTQAERQVLQARLVAEQEVIQARQATVEAQAAQHGSQQLLTVAKADFDRMQEQMNNLQDLVQQQMDLIQRLQSQRDEAKQPSNGTDFPEMLQSTWDPNQASLRGVPQGTTERSAMPHGTIDPKQT